MIVQGLVVMVAGVSIVFLFLSLLFAVKSVSAKIIPMFNHILPDEDSKVKTRRVSKEHAPKHAVSHEEDVAVAIAAAIAHQRNLA